MRWGILLSTYNSLSINHLMFQQEKSSVTSDRIRKMRENVDIQEREVKKAMKNKLTVGFL